MSKNFPDASPETLAAQALGFVEPLTGAITPPVYIASTYEREADLSYARGHIYGRPDNQTVRLAEDVLTKLEGGAASLLVASGMSAATGIFMALKPGDTALVPEVMYWGVRKWLNEWGAEWGVKIVYYQNDDMAALKALTEQHRPALIWAETPSNPMWTVTDLAEAARIAHSVGAKLAVDSTVATPVLSRPLEHGADLVMHSATKYINGHSDVIAGAITTAKEDDFWRRIVAIRKDVGTIIGPFEAWLLLRGMRTLHIRVRAASANAMAIARHFEHHPKLEKILYPGLPAHPGHAIAARQMSGGFSGMLSMRVKGGEQKAIALAANLKLFKRATSLGGVESLVEHRRSVEGDTSPVPGDLLRFSVGIEKIEDLIADLEQALAAI